jgi:nucleotide-binding universal stress UspA family protein
MSTGRTALATRPRHPGPPGRLVVVSDGPDAPEWVPSWCRGAGRELHTHRVPARLPGGRAAPTDLLDAVTCHAEDLVLVTRPALGPGAVPQVAVAVQDLPDDARVLTAAAEAVRHLGGSLIVIHGVPLSFGERSVGLDPAVQHGRMVLDAACDLLRRDVPGLPVAARLLRAHPHELVGEELDTDLLVVGGPGPRAHHRLGLVARSALHHALCPVLLVPR